MAINVIETKTAIKNVAVSSFGFSPLMSISIRTITTACTAAITAMTEALDSHHLNPLRTLPLCSFSGNMRQNAMHATYKATDII